MAKLASDLGMRPLRFAVDGLAWDAQSYEDITCWGHMLGLMGVWGRHEKDTVRDAHKLPGIAEAWSISPSASR